MSSYTSLANTLAQYKNGPSREGWYNTPGSSPYELNMNVSTGQGPHFGPKNTIFANIFKHAISTNAIIIVLLIILIFLFM